MKILVSLQAHPLYLLQYMPLYLCLFLICCTGMHVGEECYLTNAIEIRVKTLKNTQLLQYFNLKGKQKFLPCCCSFDFADRHWSLLLENQSF